MLAICLIRVRSGLGKPWLRFKKANEYGLGIRHGRQLKRDSRFSG